MKKIKFLSLIVFLLFTSAYKAQKGKGHHGGQHHKTVVVKKSRYRPNKIVVYRPHWHPKFVCNRRWVFFPKYNLYWDNWRNHYVFYNGSAWISQANAPSMIVNVNLEKEKKTELKADEDEDDEIYKSNSTHQSEYKAE